MTTQNTNTVEMGAIGEFRRRLRDGAAKLKAAFSDDAIPAETYGAALDKWCGIESSLRNLGYTGCIYEDTERCATDAVIWCDHCTTEQSLIRESYKTREQGIEQPSLLPL